MGCLPIRSPQPAQPFLLVGMKPNDPAGVAQERIEAADPGEELAVEDRIDGDQEPGVTIHSIPSSASLS